jgi:hypothetical protein
MTRIGGINTDFVEAAYLPGQSRFRSLQIACTPMRLHVAISQIILVSIELHEDLIGQEKILLNPFNHDNLCSIIERSEFKRRGEPQYILATPVHKRKCITYVGSF